MSQGSPDLGVDAGGTFTDFVTRDGRVLKLSSDALAPGSVLEEGAGRLLAGARLLGERAVIVHGTTIATNALLTGRLARVGLVVTAGFGDVLAIGRQNRPDLYAREPRPARATPPRELVAEVEERIGADGRVVTPLDEDAVRRAGERLLARGAESLAVCFLHSWRNPRHERRAARLLAATGLPVTASAELVPEFREFERFSTAWANAALLPLLRAYAADLGRRRRRLATKVPGGEAPALGILRSDGGRASLAEAAREPVQLVLSGPAGGIVGAWNAAASRARRRLLTLDMGGTSTDVALLDGGTPLVSRTEIAGHPLLVPVIDIHTVGAGGGSIAVADRGGALRVGPASAGADPGPAAYGRGGPATVTDANVVLDRIPPGRFLGGTRTLDRAAAAAAVDAVARPLGLDRDACALGIVRIAEVAMVRALRAISLERGHDPRRFSLVAFGGAGALHAAALARSLDLPEVVVPTDPGLLSAKGMLHARVRREASRTVLGLDLEELLAAPDRAFGPLESRLVRELGREGITREDALLERRVDLRYRGQSYDLSVPFEATGLRERFEADHEHRFGFRQPGAPVEVLSLRVRALGPELSAPRRRRARGSDAAEPEEILEVGFAGGRRRTPVFRREALGPGTRIAGPAVVVEYSATTLVPPDFAVEVDGAGNLVLRRTS
ncbi:MAG: hydantoinase/oxoprolinase family protein [Planctomycetota bacterium]